MKVIVTPKDPPSEPLTFDDLREVVFGHATRGEPDIDAVILRFNHGTEAVLPLKTYLRIEIEA